VRHACFQKIPRGDDRVHESVGKGLLASACGQMKDDRHILSRGGAIFARQKIAFDHFNPRPVAAVTSEGFDPSHFTGGPGETAQVAESKIEQTPNDPGANESGCSRYEKKIVLPDNKIVALHLAGILPLVCDVWVFYRIYA
jgi:hypothetical protein